MPNSQTSGSVSKGVFAFRGEKKKAEKGYYFDDKDATIDSHRKAVCDDLWEDIDTRIKNLQTDLDCKIFEDLLHFVKTAHHDARNGKSDLSCKEIPTAALVTGVNMPDHGSMFNNLVSRIKEHVTKHVALLRSKDCPNIKTVMAKIIFQIMGQEVDEDYGDEQPNLKRISSTLSVLSSWYKNTNEKKRCEPKYSSPRKRIGSPVKHVSPAKRASPRKQLLSPEKGNSPKLQSSVSPGKSSVINKRDQCWQGNDPIVIVMEDLEGFPPEVLQDFVTICSHHLLSLPIVLVLGIATSVTTVHRLLPSGVSSLLCIEKFQAPHSSEYLTQVLDRAIMTSTIPFKLGDKVFNLLLDLFLYHDFSVLNFIRGLQFAWLDHCYNECYTLLCQPVEDAEPYLQQMSAQQINTLKLIPSMASYIEGKSDNERKIISRDDSYTKKIILEQLKKLENYHRIFFPVLQCLHACVGVLPRYPLGKQLREVYATCLNTNICDTETYKEAMTLLNTLSRNDLLDTFKKCRQELQNVECDKLQELKNKMDNYITKLNDTEALGKVAQPDEEVEEADLDVGKEKLKLHHLRQKLQEMEKKKKKLTVFEMLRTESLQILDETFQEFLICPSSFALHEVLYYNDASALRKHINGSPRAIIQRGLSDPQFYLQHDDLVHDGGFISPNLLDICIVYKLHLECGRLINLYDWLQAFITIVSAAVDDEDSTDQKNPDEVLQARFIRAVSELQFLGFIKSTKRKTDHVARLTWGGC